MIGQAAVDILLATYNGERFLAAQLDSIVSQTYDDWRLLVRDDGSTDGTRDILRGYAGDHLERIVVVEDDDQGLGARGNFERLMQHSDARYIMFCDQDDVWLADKISRLLEALRKLEKQHGADIPLLVHSDLKVVGPDCEELQPSFFAYQRIEPLFGRCVNRLLVQNVVTGCASIFNRTLLERALPIPADAAMHDWWLALVAASFGRVAHVPETTVLYRQHGENAIGARPIRFWSMLLRGIDSPTRAYTRARNAIMAMQRQARAFLCQFDEQLPAGIRETVARFASLSEQGFIARRMTILRRKFLARGLLSKLLYLTFV
jgi:glycosyltransferase involved in cell wall biosynthesis